MSFSEIEIKRIEKELDVFLAKHRPPVHIRNEVDLSYRITGQIVDIFEIRSGFKNPSEKVEIPVARAKYVKNQNHWLVYWHRSDMKWHKYSPMPNVKSIKEFLDLVSEDKNACFFG